MCRGQDPVPRDTTTKKELSISCPAWQLEPGPAAAERGGLQPHSPQCSQAEGGGGMGRHTWPSTMPASSRVISGWVSSFRPSWPPIFQRRDSRCTTRSFFNSDSTKPESQRDGHGTGRRRVDHLLGIEGRGGGSGSPNLTQPCAAPGYPQLGPFSIQSLEPARHHFPTALPSPGHSLSMGSLPPA